MNVKSREWVWVVSGLSMMLLGGCMEAPKGESLSTDRLSSKGPETPKTLALAPEPQKEKTQPKAGTPDVKKGTPKAGSPAAPETVAHALAEGYGPEGHLAAVYFDLSQSKLNAGAMAAIQQNADWFKQNPPYLIQVAGFADPRGSVKRNRTLAERRAINVRDAYAALGIPKERIRVAAVMDDKAACADLTEECFATSRRAETWIETKSLAAR